MSQEVSGEYLRNAVLTATSEQLVLMLYDGAIRFARQGKEAIEREDFETSCEKLLRAQRIVQELQAGLRREENPEICDKMSSLYNFICERLVRANMKRETTPIDEAVIVLEHQRETWRLLLNQVHGAATITPSEGDSPAEIGAALSVNG